MLVFGWPGEGSSDTVALSGGSVRGSVAWWGVAFGRFFVTYLYYMK